MGAVSFIETMDHSSLSNITQEEFERYYCSAFPWDEYLTITLIAMLKMLYKPYLIPSPSHR